MTRRVFFSFHYDADSWRAAQVRKMGMVDGNAPVSDNAWETVKRGGKPAIKQWIANQMRGRTCTVVLIGSNTAGRPWINHEIIESWNKGMGVVGIYIHGLKDQDERTASKGRNPFNGITVNVSGNGLSSIVKCYNPHGIDSQERYGWIRANLPRIVEEAVSIRKKM